ncbi:hypothetical protein EDF46_0541 [Frondihabitans sp. PhB188]|uniref:hypothetical protein n=1 Tax=Frondihabitans sp. PhB188 TaxID=2485200 RepID=UPI000F4703AB|nr:hypothetical protein [Frondihabitans sp. PhB188]ROQ41167.1 hypothetical protein EDF46_0541 [Frondihabitans sp. PhB188]
MPSLKYDVTVSRDEDAWRVEIAPIGGTATARWLGEADDVARAFIADFEDVEPDTIELDIVVEYPGDVEAQLDRAAQLRTASDEALDAEWNALGRAADQLDAAGVTKRDIGDILGLAVPRVRRILRGGARENTSRLDAQ